MESRAPFFYPSPIFQANYLYLNEIKLSVIFILNDKPLLFLVHNGERRLSGQRIIGSSKTNSALLRWIDGPMSRFCVQLRPDLLRKLCIFGQKPDRWVSIIAQWVHFRVKTCFIAGHFVIVSCVFIYIAGSTFIFNISKGQRPLPIVDCRLTICD